MATALDIIKRSMRLLGVYAIGETPSADESADALTALNALVTSLPPQFIYAQTLDTIALTANTANITVGPSGTTITERPVEVLPASYITYQNVSYPLKVATLQDYNEVPFKTNTGIPVAIWPLMTMPNAAITFYPIPFAAMTLNLWSNKQVTTFPALTTVLTLPQGYERALAYMLAIDIAPEYDRDPNATVIQMANQARKNLKRTNTQIPMLQMPAGIPQGGYWQGYVR